MRSTRVGVVLLAGAAAFLAGCAGASGAGASGPADDLGGRNLSIARQRVGNLEATNPVPEITTYPPDWPQLTERRLAR